MEEKEHISRIIRTFFGKNFSGRSRYLFYRWFRGDKDKSDKETIMYEIWKESPSELRLSTQDDWTQVEDKIAPAVSFYRKWRNYAAILIAVILSSFLTRLFTYTPTPLKEQEMAEYFVPYGESRQLTLPDGSEVRIYAGSFIVYPKNFTTDTRTVYLTGEASFHVAKNPAKPFIVKTAHLEVEALGTVFNVQAYPNDKYTTATLEEGSIRVGLISTTGRDSLILIPSESLVYSHLTGKAIINKIDIEKFKLKENGYLVFEDASFETIVKTLERKYNVTISYNADRYKTSTYYIKISPDETLEEALRVLKHLASHFNYTIQGSNVMIY